MASMAAPVAGAVAARSRAARASAASVGGGPAGAGPKVSARASRRSAGGGVSGGAARRRGHGAHRLHGLVEVRAVAVEVDDVVRLATILRGAKHPPEHVEGGRAQHVEVDDLARGALEAIEELAGDGAKGDVVATAGTADDEQDADGAAAG